MKDYKRLIDLNKVANHIAVIMDGNGRWAEKRSLPRLEGHRKGAEVIGSLMDSALELKIKAISLYTFSTENWSRPKSEIDGLWSILESYVQNNKDKIHENGVKLVFSGVEKRLPSSVRKTIENIREETEHNQNIIINFCINYGGRQEIINSVNKWIEKRKDGENITINKMNRYLYTAGLPDVDLMIRTGGEYRISNFLLWQLAYVELVFMKVLWPDFKPYHLYKAIYEFQKRERRFGGL